MFASCVSFPFGYHRGVRQGYSTTGILRVPNPASQVGGWTARQIHHAVLTTFDLSEKTYGLNQLRYDLRKLKGHGLIERDGSR